MKTKIWLIVIFLPVLVMLMAACNAVSQPGDPTSQPGNTSNVEYIVWQEDRYLWISESDKLIRWDVQTKRADTFEKMTGRLLVDFKNTLWVFEKEKVSHFDGQNWEHFVPNDGFVGGYVLSIMEDNGYIWLGTSGLSRYDQNNKSWEILFKIPPGPSPTLVSDDLIDEALIEGVHSVASGSEGAIWVGTSKGLTYLEDGSQHTWGRSCLAA